MNFALIVVLLGLLIQGSALEQCSNNCSTFSRGHDKEKGTINFIPCKIQEQCKGTGPNPSKPKQDLFERKTEWYLYWDEDNSSQHVALNFSWGPTHDGTVKFTKGYHITIVNSEKLELPNHTINYCIGTEMDFYKHIFAKFFYDCFGRSTETIVEPGDKYEVQISGLPLPDYDLDDSFLAFSIAVPDCKDRRMANVTKCRLMQQFWTNTTSVLCHNHTVVFQYSVPLAFGNATVLLCGLKNNKTHLCDQVFLKENLSPKDTLYIQLPDWNRNYSISAWGSNRSGIRVSKVITLSQCKSTISMEALICVLVIFGVLIFTSACFMVYFYKRGRFKTFCQVEQGRNRPIERTQQDEQPEVPEKPESLYLLYAPDCEDHTNVVLKFANVLQNDLGFRVIFHLWNETEVVKGHVCWMEKALKEADKLVIVWSPKAKELNENCKETETNDIDMFLPAFKQVANAIFIQNHIEKYVFVKFSYHDVKRVDILKDEWNYRLYNLLDDMEMLYFRLREEEKYQPGKVLHYNTVKPDQLVLTEAGKALKEAVQQYNPKRKTSPNKWKFGGNDFKRRHIDIATLEPVVDVEEQNTGPGSFSQRQIDIQPININTSSEQHTESMVSPLLSGYSPNSPPQSPNVGEHAHFIPFPIHHYAPACQAWDHQATSYIPTGFENHNSQFLVGAYNQVPFEVDYSQHLEQKTQCLQLDNDLTQLDSAYCSMPPSGEMGATSELIKFPLVPLDENLDDPMTELVKFNL